MYIAILIVAFAAMPLAVLFLRARRRPTRPRSAAEVCRQHVYLFQGGRVSESAVESARVAIQRLLEAGDVNRVAEALRPGKQFAAQVRALTEIGSERAREVLERQLERQVTSDPLEQAWYRLDVARHLRKMNRLQSMSALIRCAAGAEGPLTHFLAAEAACFPCFAGFMNMLDTPLGRDALRVLLRTLQGLRCGVEPRVVAAGRLAEAVEAVWDNRLDGIDPLAVRLFAEVRRFLDRVDHAERWFGDDAAACAAFREQADRLIAFSDGVADYLDVARDQLLEDLRTASPDEQRDILLALLDLKVDTAAVVIPMLDCGRLHDRDLAIDTLVHSLDPSIGPWLCFSLGPHVEKARVSPGIPSLSALKALRHHPSEQAEAILLRASADRNPSIRLAALGSLGWWVPIGAEHVLARLREARFDRVPAILGAAQAALARLGERHALQWFRGQLTGEQPEPIHRVLGQIADEGLVLLWPDVDALADADDSDVALHACETLEQLREEFMHSGAPR